MVHKKSKIVSINPSDDPEQKVTLHLKGDSIDLNVYLYEDEATRFHFGQPAIITIDFVK